jgi:hypothetical protein
MLAHRSDTASRTYNKLPNRTRTLRRRTDRADRSRSVTARSLLTALPSRIDADELTFATADGPTFFQPLPVDGD